MRCPKCGYISFDHLEECLKCNKNIKEISGDLFGSTYNVQAPNFLKLQQEQKEEASEQSLFSGEESFAGEDDYLDEDLEILVEEGDTTYEREIGFVEDEQTDLELLEEDEDDGEIEIDFSQFEDADEFKVDLFDEKDEQQEQVAQPSLTMEMPEELSDISDLAPPAKDIEEIEPVTETSADSDLVDLDLDDLDFDLGLGGLGGLDGEQPSRPEVPEEAVLALDEIDFSETLAEDSSDTSKKFETMDMDDSLDFDLDLGGLSIHSDA